MRVESPAAGGTRLVRRDSVRVVIAEDSVLFREGLARMLAEGGFDVAAQAGDADGAPRAVRRERPELAIVDVRMPPTQTDEAPARRGEIGPSIRRSAVLVLSQTVEVQHAFELFSERPEGFGYMLKDRVLDVDDFHDAAAGRPRRHRRRPRGRRRSSWAGDASKRSAGGADGARAGGARADGGGRSNGASASSSCSARRPSSRT